MRDPKMVAGLVGVAGCSCFCLVGGLMTLAGATDWSTLFGIVLVFAGLYGALSVFRQRDMFRRR